MCQYYNMISYLMYYHQNVKEDFSHLHEKSLIYIVHGYKVISHVVITIIIILCGETEVRKIV